MMILVNVPSYNGSGGTKAGMQLSMLGKIQRIIFIRIARIAIFFCRLIFCIRRRTIHATTTITHKFGEFCCIALLKRKEFMENPQHRVLPKHSTDPELEVHSVDFEETHPRTQWIERPRSNTQSTIEEKPKIVDFISASIQPSENNQRSFHEYGYDNARSEGIKEENKSNTIDLGYHFTFSDDDESIFHDKEGIGFSIYDSIRAIRDEAKKIDAVLAVDQVDRMQEEMKYLRSELQRQSVKTEELSAQVQMKDGQIGTLELERDLYKADTNKLANDLECCLMKLRRVGGTSSPIEIGYGRSGIVPTMNQNDIASPPQIITADCTSDTSDPVSQLDQSTSPLLPPSCTESPAGTSITTATTEKHSPNQERKTLSMPRKVKDHHDKTSGHQHQSEKQQFIPRQRRGNPQSAIPNRGIDVETTTSTQTRRNMIMLFSLCLPQPQNKKVNNSQNRSLSPAPKTATLDSRKMNKESSKAQKPNPQDITHLPSGLLQEQVQVMSQRLQTSIKTSEDLRRRIATIHLYYEKEVHQLDERIMAACVERSKMEFEKSRRDAHGDGDESVHHKETEIRNSDPHNQAARKARVVTFNV